MGRECRVHRSEFVKGSQGKNMKTMWMLPQSFDFILQATEEPPALCWERNDKM